MTPVNSALVLELTPRFYQYIFQTSLYLVDIRIALVKRFVQTWLWLRDFFIARLSTFPDNHFFKFSYFLYNFRREKPAIFVQREQLMQSL